MSAQNSNLTNLGEVQSVAESRKERIETSKMLEAVEKNYQPKGGGINNILLKTASLILIWFIMLTSLYILVAGHNAPGGGFIAGLMVSGGMVLMYLCFGRPFVANTRVNYRLFLPVLGQTLFNACFWSRALAFFRRLGTDFCFGF